VLDGFGKVDVRKPGLAPKVADGEARKESDGWGVGRNFFTLGKKAGNLMGQEQREVGSANRSAAWVKKTGGRKGASFPRTGNNGWPERREGRTKNGQTWKPRAAFPNKKLKGGA